MAEFGAEHFAASMRAQYELTQRFTSVVGYVLAWGVAGRTPTGSGYLTLGSHLLDDPDRRAAKGYELTDGDIIFREASAHVTMSPGVAA